MDKIIEKNRRELLIGRLSVYNKAKRLHPDLVKKLMKKYPDQKLNKLGEWKMEMYVELLKISEMPKKKKGCVIN